MAARLGRITFKFAMLSGVEQADFSLYWLAAAGDPLSDLVNASDANISALWAGIASKFQTTTSVTAVRVDEIDVNTGHVITGLDGALPASPAGTAASTQLPLQCAAVVSLRTPFSGASFRGRMYLPAMALTALDTAGTFSAGTRTAITSSLKTYINSVVTASTGWEPVVFSRTLHSATVITKIDMGSVVDTQRRRRASLVESRTTVTIP